MRARLLWSGIVPALLAPATAGASGSWQSPVKADGGIPVEYADGTMYLFGDTIAEDGRFHNSSVVLDDGTVLLDVLPAAPNDGWYWLMDGELQPDGRFAVVASELQRDSTSWFGFRRVDTDVFVVRDPTNLMSWRLAEHVDVGWWDAFCGVRFSYAGPVGRTCDETGGSDGVIFPVLHDGHEYRLTWRMGSGRVVVYRGGDIAAEWQYEPNTTYGHSLAVIDGELIHYWSTWGDRVTYEPVTL